MGGEEVPGKEVEEGGGSGTTENEKVAADTGDRGQKGQDEVDVPAEPGNDDVERVDAHEKPLEVNGSGEEHGAGQGTEQAITPSAVAESPLFPRFAPMSTLNLYDVTKYTFGTKGESQKDSRKSSSAEERQMDLEEKYKKRGMRRSVGAVLLLQNHRFPHILLLQSSKRPKSFVLPGGRLRPGENDVDGLMRKLQSKLSPPAEVATPPEFEIGEQIATWYSPDFSERRYPYIPAHVTKPKESHAVFTVQLPDSCTFAVPKSYQLLAVPLFEVYDNMEQYGPVITAVPSLLSRFHMNFIGG
mmetsp:Transcript_6719/g.28749  ORF Transcript_6719/g.28749 Transcript_6719/m.28749 type:complete len:300 (-) Transcript_6719:547-1446(-)